MIKNIVLLSLFFVTLYAKECSPYFNPNKFYDAPEYLSELIETTITTNNLKLFDKSTKLKELNFEKENNRYIKKDSYIQFKEYKFPNKTQLWNYSTKNGLADELNISKMEYYKYSDLEIANEINDYFDGFWSDWIEDGLSMQLVPEQVLFRYKDFYFSFSVFIYGLKNDATPLDKTVINYWFKNYTPQVQEFIECSK